MQSNGWHHKRSPLVQGGLEILCQVIVEMEMTDKNPLAIVEYKRLVSEQYQKPVNSQLLQTVLPTPNWSMPRSLEVTRIVSSVLHADMFNHLLQISASVKINPCHATLQSHLLLLQCWGRTSLSHHP